jgi:pimeloyl-ACP methyl ester carboxylesterase
MDGGSTDQAATSMDEHAGDIVDLLDALHVEDAVVGGLSMGGYVAFALVRHAARYIRAWCSPTHGRRPTRRKAWRGGARCWPWCTRKGRRRWPTK